MQLKIFKNQYVQDLKYDLISGNAVQKYIKKKFDYDESQTIESARYEIPDDISLKKPKGRNFYSFENAKTIYEALKFLSPHQATDPRLWTYLTHVTFWDYVQARSPVEDRDIEKRPRYILDHWFVDKVNPKKILRNDIALLWWNAYMTYDESREDPYELTREVLSMLDYGRNLLERTQGRYREFVHALLEFVIENPKKFESSKQDKIRLIMRRANLRGGYKIFSSLDRETIKNHFSDITESRAFAQF